MKEKELGLLLRFFHHQDQYLTSEELADTLSLSQRTIRSYIQSLKCVVKENSAEIIAKQGYGYQLCTINPMLFEMFLNKKKPKQWMHVVRKWPWKQHWIDNLSLFFLGSINVER